MSPPTPPSPPIISRPVRDENEHRASSRGRHRTARDYRASRSRSRGRGRGNGSSRLSPDRRHRQRTHSRSRSRDNSRSRYRRRPRIERSPSRHRRERSLSRHRRDRSMSRHRRERSLSRHRREKSPSASRTRRRQRSSHRSRSRSYSKTNKSSHRSKSRSCSTSRTWQQRNHRSRSGSKSLQPRDSRSRSSRLENRDRTESSTNQQAKVIVLSTESYKDSLKSSSKLPSVKEEASSSSSSTTVSRQTSSKEETPSWKRTRVDQIGVYSNLKPDAPIDKEKIHKEIEEKLRLALAREGKVYPYPKQEPSHPVFANDGSFLEIFKKMQQQQTFVQQQVGESMQIHTVPTVSVPKAKPIAPTHQPPPQLPVFGRRRGGKILKTGVVAKPQSSNDSESGDVKDFWSIYLREVKKYKSTACESDSKTRPLVR